jgi:Zn-dependent protease with chaperone function
LRVRFSLHFGAMTIALLVALTQWLNASGLLTGASVMPDDVATVFLAIAAATGGFIALRYSDFIYPAVITSGVGAMFIAQRVYDPDVAADALIVCVGMLVVVGLAAIALAQKPRRDPRGKESRRSAKVARKAQDEGWFLIDGNSSIMRL